MLFSAVFDLARALPSGTAPDRLTAAEATRHSHGTQTNLGAAGDPRTLPMTGEPSNVVATASSCGASGTEPIPIPVAVAKRTPFRRGHG